MPKQLLPLVLILGTISCQPPISASKPSASIDGQKMLKALPIERWATAQFSTEIRAYPAMARIAGISGDVVMLLTVDQTGQVTSVKLASGPPQLASTAASFLKGIRFTLSPEDLPGPWQFSATVRFDLSGKIGSAPTGQPIKLLPVATPSPTLPPGVR